MRKILATITLAVSAMTATAQEALSSTAPIVSPAINADRSVTLSLKAPAAHELKVRGTCIPGTTAVMTPAADSASWSYTTPPLAPGLYYYTFIIDGVNLLDPSNVHIMRDVATLNSYFIVKGDGDDIGTACSVNDVPHGTLSHTWYTSATARRPRRMSIYTPPGYETSGQRYPVLYLLHGMGGDENAWTELGRTAEILDNNIASGKAVPMIVVMPNGNISEDAAPGYGTAGLAQPVFNLPQCMDGTFETSFPEIVEFVDRNYRTIPSAGSRAIAGLSMGGFHAMNISREYPGTFDYIGLFSAAMLNRANGDSPVYRDTDAKLARQMSFNPRLYWIAIGTDDFLYDDNARYRRQLDEARYPYTYYETGGGHQWQNWRDYLNRFTTMIFTHP